MTWQRGSAAFHAKRCARSWPALYTGAVTGGASAAWWVFAALSFSGCTPELTVGSLTCADETQPPTAAEDFAVEVPWSTGFEQGFCDYAQSAGFCYASPGASYETVTSPVHSGRRAAAFRVTSDDPAGVQTRCVREGVLPTQAYYGAWYFVPEPAENARVWNLIHFQGGTRSAQHGLWDVSLANTTGSELQLVLFDFLSGVTRMAPAPMPIPIATWFHLQVYLKRASDATGEVALYLDGVKLVEAKNVITDDSDFGQWYVGNYANGLMPSDSTLYVDDVTIRATL